MDPAFDGLREPETDPATDPAFDGLREPETDPVTEPASDGLRDPATDAAGDPAFDGLREPETDAAGDPAFDGGLDAPGIDGALDAICSFKGTCSEFLSEILPNLCPAFVENLDIEFIALVEYLDIDSPILCLFL